jgi:hypothetical protein
MNDKGSYTPKIIYSMSVSFEVLCLTKNKTAKKQSNMAEGQRSGYINYKKEIFAPKWIKETNNGIGKQ